MGTVYRAVDETLDRDVAIKILNPDLGDAGLLKRFRAEAVTLARLNHPGIATIYELHRQDDDLLMVMEYVRGETLQHVCERVGPMAPPQAAHICIQVLDALAYAHRAGVVHRDLKPANLMISDTGVLKVMDFGIARVLGGEHLTHGGYMMGTPAYMSPEQVLGREIDGRADLYSVGVLFYRLLTGELPFRADTAIAMAQKQIADAPTPVGHFRPDLPAWCTDVIARALAKNPDERFQTAEEFRAMLASAVRPEPLSEMPTQLTPTPPGIARGLDLNGLPSTVVMGASGKPTYAVHASAVATPAAVAAVRTQSADAASPAAARSPERTTTTVVLGRTHLAAIGALFVLLAVAIGVLAYVALRQSPAPAQVAATLTPASVEAGGPAATASSTAVTSPAPPPPEATSVAGGTEPAPAPQPGSVAPTAAPAAPPTQRGVGTGGTGQRGLASRSRGAAPGGSSGRPDATTSAAPGGTGARADVPTSAAPNGSGARPGATAAANDAEAKAPVPAVPLLTFDEVRLLEVDAGGRGREREATLQLTGNQIVIVDRARGGQLTTLPFSKVVSAHYSRSRKPKWRDASGKEVESQVDLGPLGFLRSDRNWLILIANGQPVVLRFEDTGLQTKLATIQYRMGVKIQR